VGSGAHGYFGASCAVRVIRSATRRSGSGFEVVFGDVAEENGAIRRSTGAPGVGTRPGRGGRWIAEVLADAPFDCRALGWRRVGLGQSCAEACASMMRNTSA